MSKKINYPPQLKLAHLPTPLNYLERTSDEIGCKLWLKRDDLTGVGLSGNKIRKLDFLVAEAQAQGAQVLITCGGINSNHCRATAIAAARCGLKSHLLLRGDDRPQLKGNLFLDRMVGAQITFISADEWKNRQKHMDDIAQNYLKDSLKAYIIPEGGSNAVGAMGYAQAAVELIEQCRQQGFTPEQIVHATGSGGTTAGLALGLASLGLSEQINLASVAVCYDQAEFDRRINQIVEEAQQRGFVSEEIAQSARWQIVEGYVGEGYAQATESEMKAYIDTAQTEGIFLDPVYTGKAFSALKELSKGYENIVFIHTGGLFELFSYDELLRQSLD